MNKIEKQFWDKGIVRPNGLWIIFSKKIAIQFIEACKKESIKILGIDGFVLHNRNKIELFQEHSIDFTSVSHHKKDDFSSWDEAIRFLEKQPDEIHFEIVSED